MVSINLVLIAFGVWLSILSVFVFLNLFFFAKLQKGSGEVNLKKVLENLLGGQAKSHSEIEELFHKVHLLEEEGRLHVQKVSLVRFNPFHEMGGEHSFSLALLDGRNTGVVITGLHTRDRTRIYMKTIKAGKCEFELSDEEKKAVMRAQRG